MSEIREKLGLKGSTVESHCLERLNREGIEIYEFHLFDEDLIGKGLINLRKQIEMFQSKGVRVKLHHPMFIGKEFLELDEEDSKASDFFNLSTRILVDLCEEYDIYTVIHLTYETQGREGKTYKNELIRLINKAIEINDKLGKGRLMWENAIDGTGFYGIDFELANLIKGTDLPLCMDISHLAIGLEAEGEELNDYIEKTLEILKDNIVYYHVVDTSGIIHDGLVLGDGVIDFKRIKKYIIEKDYIYEVSLKDFSNCDEMVRSHEYFIEL